jgi:hypothetical protein
MSTALEVLVARPATGHPAAQLYADDPLLMDAVVARFVSAGLDVSDRMVVIATPSHRNALVGRRLGRGIDRAVAGWGSCRP